MLGNCKVSDVLGKYLSAGCFFGKRGDWCPMNKISYKAQMSCKKLDSFFGKQKEEEEE